MASKALTCGFGVTAWHISRAISPQALLRSGKPHEYTGPDSHRAGALAIRKRGGRKLAIAADGSTLAPLRPRIDNTLVRAHRWNKLLESGRYGSAAELAAAEKINPSYVSRVLRLTLLATGPC